MPNGYHRRDRRLAGFLWLSGGLLLGVSFASAQSDRGGGSQPTPEPGRTPIERLAPPSMIGDNPSRAAQNEMHTIRAALADLDSEDAELRRGAVMLLAKYDNAVAVSGLVSALDDPDVRVRRSALVSVLEQRRDLVTSDWEKVMSLISDEDAEIRRMVSAALDFALPIWRTRTQMANLNRAASEVRLPEDIQEGMIAAFRDPEPIVRRNMLRNQTRLWLPVPNAIFLELMADPVPEVRLSAVQVASQATRGGRESDAFVQRATELADMPEPVYRRALARAMADHGSAAALRLLDVLIEADEESVATEAEISRFGLRPNMDHARPLVSKLEDNRLDEEQARRFVSLLPLLPASDIRRVCGQLLRIDNSSARAEVTRLWLIHLNPPPDGVLLAELLADPSAEVRRAVLQFVQPRAQSLDEGFFGEVVFNPHEDVRQAVLEWARSLPEARARPILLDLLIDENQEIREMALTEMARRPLPGWEEMAFRSLRDPDPRMQRAGVVALLRYGDDTDRKRLLEFVDENPATAISGYIERRLKSF